MTTSTPAVFKPDNHGHLLELDGIRGIAIIMVMVGHAYRMGSLLAVPGVGLFFVLSGFLITRILLGSVGKAHFFSNFYARRALRIWPLYFLILGVAYLTPAFSFSHAEFPAYRFMLYIQNFWSLDKAPPILGTTWSLAIEEQFYLVWPLVIWLLHSTKRVGWAAVALIAAAPLMRVLFYLHGIDPYAMTLGRLDGLATGAGLAVITFTIPRYSSKIRTLFIVCIGVSLILLPMLHIALLRKAFKDTSTSLFFGCLIGFAFYWQGSRFTRLLRSAVLRFFGRISYCAYLIHLSLIYRMPSSVLSLAITTAVATLSWYSFEKPILRLKDRLTRTDFAAPPVTLQEEASLPVQMTNQITDIS